MLRILSFCGAVAVCGVTLALLIAQRRELGSLREQEQRLRPQAAESAPPVAAAGQVSSPPKQHTPSAELLRLRGEVGQLERRKRELSTIRTQNEQLRNQLAAKGTSTPGGIVLPADYIRKSAARFAGYGTPEDTVQSLLSAIQNRDVAGFVQAFSPEAAERTAARIQSRSSPEEFFKEADALPGLRIVRKDKTADDIVTLTVEFLPGEAHQTELRLKQFDGQWKFISGF